MARNPFGWNYPAGAENDPRAPWNDPYDPKCEVCGLEVDDCTCEACPECGEIGNPKCSETHWKPSPSPTAGRE